MKNKEKYAKEIIEIACSGNSIAVTKEFGHIESCSDTFCNECLFCADNCKERVREWAESEYIEKPVISKRDRVFLDYIGEEYKFIARDENGELFVYIGEPHKLIDCWEVDCCENVICEADKPLQMFNIDLPMIKWEDNEPWLIEDLKKLEVVEEYENMNMKN